MNKNNAAIYKKTHDLTKQETQFLEGLGLDLKSENLISEIQELLKKEEVELTKDFDEGGISKTQNWQGGGEFIYLELKKHNQTFIDKIEVAKNTGELLKIWDEMKKKSFLNYNVDIKKQDEHLEGFKALTISEQKWHLLEILDKNQLYVNLSSLEDSDFACDDGEKQLTKDFYQIRN